MMDARDDELLRCLIARCVVRAIDAAREGADFLATFNREIICLMRKFLEMEAGLNSMVIKTGEELGFRVYVKRGLSEV